MKRRAVDAVMLEARAASFRTRSIKGRAKLAGLNLAISMIDLTTLEGKDSPEKVRGLCVKAARPGDGAGSRLLQGSEAAIPSAAAVCVYPAFVGLAKAELAALGASHVKVAAVATGFPSGQYPLEIRLADTTAAVRDGADEIDMVINRGAFLAGRYDEVADEIRRVRQACRRPDGSAAHLKVILETGELETYENIRLASDLAIAAITDDSGDSHGNFIKTSTGKVQPAATMASTLVMLEAIRDHALRTGHMVGMKPAGGIRTAKDALHYLVMVKETLGDAWLSPTWFRFGASALLNDLLRQLARHTAGQNGRPGAYAAGYDFAEA